LSSSSPLPGSTPTLSSSGSVAFSRESTTTGLRDPLGLLGGAPGPDLDRRPSAFDCTATAAAAVASDALFAVAASVASYDALAVHTWGRGQSKRGGGGDDH
jgi:hypothetical protein